jgi:cysteine desulfurase
LEEGLLTIAGSFQNGHREQRLGNTANIGFKGVSAEQLIIGLGRISVSNGSACSSTITKPSHVLKAMGLKDADGLSSLRFSLGRFTTAAEIEMTIEKTKAVVDRLRVNG